MEIKPQDNSQEKLWRKIKIIFGAIVLHTFLIWANVYSNQLYSYFMVTAVMLLLISYLEIGQFKLSHTLKAIYVGLTPAVSVFLMPKYLFFGLSTQFMALNHGVSELNWIHMPYLFMSNIFSWVACFAYYKVQAKGDSDVLSVISFLEDNSQIYQVLLSFAMNYIVIILYASDKYVDIKTRKQYESKLVQLNADLEVTNAKLQKSNKELQEALQEKENFILRFSHEIRNPLNSLLGNIELCYGQMVDKELEQMVDKELEQMLQDAKVSGEILLQLLNNVLDTAKVATGRLEVSKSFQDIREFLEGSWVICSEIIRKKKLYGCLSVNVRVPELLEFDHHRLMQILINTVSNAAKFTDHGSVKVFVDFIVGSEIKREDMRPKYGILPQSQMKETEDLNEDYFSEKPKSVFENLTSSHKKFRVSQATVVQIQNLTFEIPLFKGKFIGKIEDDQNGSREIRTNAIRPMHYPTEGYIRFEIADTGCGISKEYLENAFEKFQQVNSDSSKRQIGTGLGLWITKEIIEMMNGKIEIFSKQNIGTTIVIMVKTKATPFSASSRSPRLTTVSSQRIPYNSSSSFGRVLMVEDIQYNQEVNRKFFRKCGIEDITIASNGQEAVDLFLNKGPQYFDLVLMDIDMPIMDGKTAVKIIRQHEEKRAWKPVNIVFLTGFAEAKTQKELLDEKGVYKANGFYSKPASVETFRRIVKNFMPLGKDMYMESAQDIRLKPPRKEKALQMTSTLQKIPLYEPLVLVVDDDSFNLTMVIKMLTLYKINTLEARNGQEAVRVYEENWKRISCILMDCEMPILDGLEATQKILAKHRQRAVILGRSLNIYGLTGHVGREYRKRCLEAGMKDVLEKPIKIDMLSSILRDSITK